MKNKNNRKWFETTDELYRALVNGHKIMYKDDIEGEYIYMKDGFLKKHILNGNDIEVRHVFDKSQYFYLIISEISIPIEKLKTLHEHICRLYSLNRSRKEKPSILFSDEWEECKKETHRLCCWLGKTLYPNSPSPNYDGTIPIQKPIPGTRNPKPE